MSGIDPQQRRDKRAADDRNRGLEAYQRRSVEKLAQQMQKLPETIGTAVASAMAARSTAFAFLDESGTASDDPTLALDGASTTNGAVLGWEFENTSIEGDDVEDYNPRVIWYYVFEPGTEPPLPEAGNPNGHPGSGWRYLGPGDEKTMEAAMSLMVLRDGAAGDDLPYSLFVKRATS